MAISRILEFLKLESSAGLILMGAALLGIILDNSPLAYVYDGLLTTPVVMQVGELAIAKPLLLWINDGLMAIFFLLVGLEIKREILEGELSSWDKASLPLIAAVGGMAVPALIYVWFNLGDPVALTGWAIPAATDIAFALAVLMILGNRVPVALKIFLLAIAIIDDLGAILIIAIFYTSNLSFEALGLAAIGLAVLIAFNRRGIPRTAPYLIVGAIMWVCVLKSGVHATLAGVLIALTIPIKTKNGAESPLRKLEHDLHPSVAYLILPAFAFANAGVPLLELQLSDLLAPVPLGVALGLFLGKQIGVFLFTALAVGVGLARLPEGMTMRHVYGVACLTGIGFTMSLFIGTLAFDTAEQLNAVRLGVLTGSLLSALLGYAVLRLLAAGPVPARQAAH